MQLSKNLPQVSDLTLDQFQAMLVEVRDSLINDVRRISGELGVRVKPRCGEVTLSHFGCRANKN
jgi:hypothetical protein